MNSADHEFEIGKLYCDRGDFDKAISHINSAAATYFSTKDYNKFLECKNLLLRSYAELDQLDLLNETKEKLQDLVLKEGFELTSKTYYVLGLSAFYKNQLGVAQDYLQKSLELALAKDNKEDLCRAIFGLANCYAHPSIGKYSEALKEIYNLEVFFQVLHLPELRTSALFVNAKILVHFKKHNEAIDILWQAYDLLKETKNIVMATYLMVALADVYYELGERDLAKMYISLAGKSIAPPAGSRLDRTLKEYKEKIGGAPESHYDLIFDNEKNLVIEKKIGKVDFKSQFILLDLLRLFVQNQGRVYSKEYLVENVWKQPYDPSVHDNKIYVTIKRLRKMIEPDFDKPKYIFRAKNGYFMNKSVQVHMEH